MKAEIISVGTEILLGHIVNTNVTYIAKRLASLGIDLYYQATVGDNPSRLSSLIKDALSRSDIVFTTGGLGPTVDDITLAAICQATGRKLVFEKKIERLIARHFLKRGLVKTPKDALRQACIPHGVTWFKNTVGTAPAIVVEKGKKALIALPGPPRELGPIFEHDVIPYLKEKGAGEWLIKTKTIRVVGLVEATVNNIVKDLLTMGPKTTLGIYVHLGVVDLKITSKAKSEKNAFFEIQKVEKEVRRRLGNHIYGTDNETLESVVGKMLARKKMTIALAESCTGGLIANRMTNVSGSSNYFKMSVIAYSNEAKVKLLGVSSAKIKKYGAVSKEIALDMAKGIKKLSKSALGLGVTGIAGPRGATGVKPVGLIYIAVVTGRMKLVRECHFTGSRVEIKLQASTAALDLIRASCVPS